MDKVDKALVRIPEKFKSIVKMDLKESSLTGDPKAGEYDPFEDIIHFNPELLSVSVIAEEFYHRKQDQILRTKGLSLDEYKANLELYNPASELGIIPIIRDIEIRKGNPDADFNFWRYCLNAVKFSMSYTSLSDEGKKRFKDLIAGEELFSGIAYVIETIESDEYHQECWQKTAVKDPRGIDYWDEINKRRKNWVKKYILSS